MMAILVARALWELFRYDFVKYTGRPSFAVPAIRAAKNRDSVDWTLVSRLRRAFDQAIVWYPKPVRCLQSSIASVRLYRRYGLPAEVLIGYSRRPLRCHAWVELDNRPVNQGEDYGQWMTLLHRV